MKHESLKYTSFSFMFLYIGLFSLMANAIESKPEEPFNSPGLYCSNPLYQNNTSSESSVDGNLLWGDTTLRWGLEPIITYSIDMKHVTSSEFSNLCRGSKDANNNCEATSKRLSICKSSDTLPDCRVKLQNYIKPFAEVWATHGKLTLKYISTWKDADIRIRFADNSGAKSRSFSKLGTQAKRVKKDKSTMVLGVTFWDSDWIESTITHEFGHALGLVHEHLRSDKSYTIDKKKAYGYYLDKNGWEPPRVDNNVLKTINITTSAYYNFSEYDPKSIMQYSIPAEIVDNTDNCPESVTTYTGSDKETHFTPCVSQNAVLSDIDKAHMAFFYPMKGADIYSETHPITGISIASGSNRKFAKEKACINDYYKELINVDLNAGAGGNFIYMCLARVPNGVPLADFATTNTLDGCPVGYDVYETDLNHTVGGEFIYLCAKYARPFFGSAQPIYEINIGSAGSRAKPGVTDVRNYDRYAKSNCLGKNNNEFPDLLDKDLNAGAKGNWIYLCSSKKPSSDSALSLTSETPRDKVVKLCNTANSGENITIAQMSHSKGYLTEWLSKDLGTIAPTACKTFNFGKNYSSMVYFYAYTSTGKEWPVKKIYSDRRFCVKQGGAWSFPASRNDQCTLEDGFLMRGAGSYLKEGVNTINISPKLNIRSVVIRKRNGDATAGGIVKTSLSSAIDCGTDCIATFKGSFLQDKITLNATPNSISNFAGWRGCRPVKGKPLTCMVTTTEDKIVEAFFTRKPILIVDTRGIGRGKLTSSPLGLNCGSDCIYENGGIVTVKAEPNSHSYFDGWRGIGSKNCSDSSLTCKVSVDDFQYLVAEFDLLPSEYTLTVNKTGNGRVLSESGDIDCGIQCQSFYPRKEVFSEAVRVSLTPILETGSVFMGWSGACSGKGECRLIMNKKQAISATFSEATPQKLIVKNLNDSGDGSLRQAIINSNNNPGSDTIILTKNLSGTITLIGGSLKITDSFTLEGPGADKLTISGNNTSRVFEIAVGAIETVSISGVTIAEGHVFDGEGGGGIYISRGDVMIKNSVFSENTVVGGSGGGAAIRKLADAGSLTVINCSFFDNSAIDKADEFGSADGGAIRNDINQLTVINSTFSNNKARFGGAIYNPQGRAIIRNSTIANNTATESGGGIYNNDELVISNNIISGNTSTAGVRELFSSTLISEGNNLFGENGNSGVSASLVLSNNDLIHTGTIDTVIGALTDNGSGTPSRFPVKGSSVINTGNNILIPAGITTDQRGEHFPRIVGGIVDIGAIEYFSIVQADILSITQAVSADPIHTNQEYNYVITVINNGLFDVENIEVENTLPLDVTFINSVGIGWTCIEDKNTVNCSLLKLLAGTRSKITITVRAPHNEQVSDNYVAVFSSIEETNFSNNTSTKTTITQLSNIVSVEAHNLMYVPLDAPCRIVNTGSAGSPFNNNRTTQSFIAWGNTNQLNPQRDKNEGLGLTACLPENSLKPSAMAANVTVAAKGSRAKGNVVTYPFGSAIPSASMVNFFANNIANSSIITLSPNSSKHFTVRAKINGFNSGGSQSANVIIDTLGYFYPQEVLVTTPNTGLSYIALPQPCRIVNTVGIDKPFQALTRTRQAFIAWGTSQALDAQRDVDRDKNLGACLPESNMKPTAMMANITVAAKRYKSIGNVVAFKHGDTPPTASLVNFSANNIANASIISLSPETSSHFDIEAKINNQQLGGSKQADVIVDTQGYFYSKDELAAAGTSGLSYIPLTEPCRIVDTRGVGQTFNDSNRTTQSFKAWGTVAELNLQRKERGSEGLLGACQPISGQTPSAVMVNVTVAAKRFKSRGNVVAYPTGTAVPKSSLVNFLANNIANSSIIAVSPDNAQHFNIEAKILNNDPGGSKQADVIVDVIGYFYP